MRMAGLIVALTALPPEWRATNVHAYRTMQNYQAKDYVVYCPYTKTTPVIVPPREPKEK
jgi:hypothetical protein